MYNINTIRTLQIFLPVQILLVVYVNKKTTRTILLIRFKVIFVLFFTNQIYIHLFVFLVLCNQFIPFQVFHTFFSKCLYHPSCLYCMRYCINFRFNSVLMYTFLCCYFMSHNFFRCTEVFSLLGSLYYTCFCINSIFKSALMFSLLIRSP